MALIHCPECNHEVSNEALSCPHCGYPLKNSPSNESLHYNVMADIRTSKHSVKFTAFISIICYIVSSIILCPLLKGNGISIKDSIESDVITCGICCLIISWIVAKSNIDRLIYLLIIILISWICIENWESLSYGTFFVTLLSQIGILVYASIKRYKPTEFGRYGINIADTIFASPLIIVLLIGEFIGYMNFAYWLRIGTSFSDGGSQILVATICGLLNWLFVRWFFKKEIADIRLRNKANKISLSILIVCLALGTTIGLLK